MAGGKTIQARDAETVLEMYHSMNVPAFALFSGNDIHFGAVPDSMSEGEQLLTQWLSYIENSKSSALYSLRVYRKVDDEADITNKRPCNGQINFRLNEISMAVGGAEGNHMYGQVGSALAALREDLKDVRERLDAKEEEQEDGEGMIGKLLNPEFLSQLPALVGMVKELFGSAGAVGQQQYREIPHTDKLGGVAESATAPLNDDEKIAASLAVLKSRISDLPDVLVKLAWMAENKPVTLQGALLMIRNMKMK